MSGEIEHVSDTAFWVATFRALESERARRRRIADFYLGAVAMEFAEIGRVYSGKDFRQRRLA